MTTEPETLKTESTDSDLQIVPTPPPSEVSDELAKVKQATQALVDALQGLAQAKLQTASDLTEEAHKSIDQSVQALRSKADQKWQTTIHQVADIDTRLTKAAKAAWEAFTTPTVSSAEPDTTESPSEASKDSNAPADSPVDS
ncbi:hypothetical protein ACN4EG_00540 [Alkalinema pantanalense CENA528]|uniref:hypothetical protein n=1 Tax=Alkalinema pantanalense TaxID=1620705 RepID=UPI003D6E4E57